ncbi:unnamed protein product [Triticum turgidum subsp. durum]|uniref:NB-ARC domain-containing protein n=1 Tax=Triticum turgidum subsp. durum TaxID=4567 RepID=A0A9R0YDN5_TRITD|nr:unnamed protein product [Triticum turgidum subsp. durum]
MRVRRSMNLLTTVNTRHKIGKELQGLKRRVMEVSERRMRYKVDSTVSKPNNTAIDIRLLALFAGTADLVGINELRDELIKVMLDGDLGKTTLATDGVCAQQLKVLSVVGFGGLGKTTLANQIYRKLEGQFQCRAFVFVSQKPNIRKILRNILSQAGYVALDQTNVESWDEDQLIRTLRRFLAEKRKTRQLQLPFIQF